MTRAARPTKSPRQRTARAATPTAASAAAPLRALGSPVAGVDEAGRGPVLGPLVVAGVLVADEAALAELGVKDSKKLTPEKREALEPLIRGVASAVVVRVVDPADLDLRMGRGTLNEVEEALFADVLTELAAPRAVLDACDVDAARFGVRVRGRLRHECDVTSEHKADDRHPCVAAASIVAKVTRDRAVAELARDHGEDVGSGYASDPRTQAFLKAFVARTGDLPPCARRRWETADRLIPKNHSIFDFTG